MGPPTEEPGPPTEEPGPANQNEFSPTGVCYRKTNCSVSSAVQGGRVSDDPAGEEAGCGGPGLVWLHVVCGSEAAWTYWQIL